MLRSAVFALASLCSITAAVADGLGDPTFNGALTGATCDVRATIACGSDACEVLEDNCVGERCGYLGFSPDQKTYQMDGHSQQPMEIIGISKAEVNKPLWLKFKVEFKGLKGIVLFTMKPNQFGSYSRSATLRFNKDSTHDGDLIVTYSCNGGA